MATNRSTTSVTGDRYDISLSHSATMLWKLNCKNCLKCIDYSKMLAWHWADVDTIVPFCIPLPIVTFLSRLLSVLFLADQHQDQTDTWFSLSFWKRNVSTARVNKRLWVAAATSKNQHFLPFTQRWHPHKSIKTMEIYVKKRWRRTVEPNKISITRLPKKWTVLDSI